MIVEGAGGKINVISVLGIEICLIYLMQKQYMKNNKYYFLQFFLTIVDYFLV